MWRKQQYGARKERNAGKWLGTGDGYGDGICGACLVGGRVLTDKWMRRLLDFVSIIDRESI